LSDGVEGVTWPDGRVIVSEATYRGAYQGNGRDRFTIVHETYHGIRHRTQIRTKLVHAGQLVLHRRSTIEPFRDPEWQANVFAAAVLMPRSMVHAMAEDVGRHSLVTAMIDVFGVSRKAAEVRVDQLGI
jgi:Zn-dependent peptidase ImmA (M78 family)